MFMVYKNNISQYINLNKDFNLLINYYVYFKYHRLDIFFVKYN